MPAHRGLVAVWLLSGLMAVTPFASATPAAPGDLVGGAFYTHAGRTDLKDPENPARTGSVALHETVCLMPVPVFENGGWQGVAGPLLEWHRFDFAGLADLDDVDLYTVALMLGVVYTGWERWELMASVAPGWYTDFRKTDTDDFKTLAHVQAGWQLSGQWRLVLGAAYDSAFGDDELYPVGGVCWDPVPAWSVRLMFPEPMVVWAPLDRLALYVYALPAGGKWNMRDKAPGHAEYDFKTESWRAGAGCEVRLGGPVWLHLSGGMDIDRKYRIEGRGDDYLLKSDVADTWFLRTGLAVR